MKSIRRKRLLAATATLFGLAGSGCSGSLLFGPMIAETPGSTARAATYDGDACERVYYDLSTHDMNDYNRNEKKFPKSKDPSPAAQILLATCVRRSKSRYGHEIKQWSKVDPIDPAEVYLALDDRNLDIVSAALSAVIITNDALDKSYHRFQGNRWRGMVLFYSSIIDRKELAAAVSQIDVPDEARAAFLAQYDDAAQRARAADLSPEEKTMYEQIPLEVVEDRQKHFKEFDALYQELDALLSKSEKAHGNADEAEKLVPSFTDLRNRFMARCGKLECRTRPLWAYATRELALLAVARGAKLDALVESYMHTQQFSYVADLPQAILAAQEAEGRKMLEARNKYEKAKKNGVDEKTALSLSGGTAGYDYRRIDLMHPDMSLPNYAKALDERSGAYVDAAEYPVASVQAAGNDLKITFVKERHQIKEAFNCRKTNRIKRIRPDGTLEYQEICNYRQRTEDVERHKPITIPAAEGKNIQQGDAVRFLAQKDEARIIHVKRGDAVVQLRGDVLQGPK